MWSGGCGPLCIVHSVEETLLGNIIIDIHGLSEELPPEEDTLDLFIQFTDKMYFMVLFKPKTKNT